MATYIALLRGINVGGNNTISMLELREAFRLAGFPDARTHINSGNVIFSSELDDALALQATCEKLIHDTFGLPISVVVLSATELADAMAHAPDWWGLQDSAKHNAIFVIPPATPESVCAEIGEIKPEYEKLAMHGKLIFWTAPMETFSRTRLSRVSKSETYQRITIRGANTARRLAELAR